MLLPTTLKEKGWKVADRPHGGYTAAKQFPGDRVRNVQMGETIDALTKACDEYDFFRYLLDRAA